jgi:hypothetical protein
MKRISVKFDSITILESQRVVDHYNTIKPPEFSNLAYLDRCEGGFQIPLQGTLENYKIKQLRWNKKKLETPVQYIGFNHEETWLLYKSFVHVFDESLVIYD